MKTWRIGALGIACAAVLGCGEPPRIIPSVPPGTEYVPPLPASEGDGAQALGEAVSQNLREAKRKTEAEQIPVAPPTAPGETKTTKSGLKYETLKEGNGAEAKGGATVSVHYTGTLENGEKFDSSRDPGKSPFSFTIGVSSVIKGWHEGVAGMRVGERRKLIIPTELAYGATGKGSIPANATLIFDIELISVN